MKLLFKETKKFGHRIAWALLADRIRFFARSRQPLRLIPYEGQEIIFVCKGNICRSPFAEAIARRSGIQALSTGLNARSGAPASEKAIQAAAAYQVDLNKHRARPFQDVDLEQRIIVCLEAYQAREILTFQPELAGRLTLLGLYGENPIPSIADPYGLSEEAFTYVFDLIESKVGALIDS